MLDNLNVGSLNVGASVLRTERQNQEVLVQVSEELVCKYTLHVLHFLL